MYGIINKVYSEEITNIKFENCKEIDEPHAQLNNFEKQRKLLHFNLNRYVNQWIASKIFIIRILNKIAPQDDLNFQLNGYKSAVWKLAKMQYNT